MCSKETVLPAQDSSSGRKLPGDRTAALGGEKNRRVGDRRPARGCPRWWQCQDARLGILNLPGPIAQISSPPCRGFPMRQQLAPPPGRLEVGDTAGWKPALRGRDSCNGRTIRHDGGKPARFFQRMACVAILLFGFTAGVRAHQGSSSYLTVTVDGTNVTGQWDISLIDLEQVIGLDADRDGNITWSETRAKQKEIESYALSRLRLKLDGVEQPWKLTELLIDTFSDGAYAVLRFRVESAAQPKNLEVDYRAFFDIDAQHHGLLRLTGLGREQTAVLSMEKPTFATTASRWRQFLEFNREGAKHIWTGFDHILFLLALLLPSVLKREPDGWRVVGRFRPALINVLKIVTALTVAHS
ncbi:MAG: hypothetical protein DMG78_32525, partial [Acidobacteria bacterium]